MKKSIFLFFLINANLLHSQCGYEYCIYFEDTTCLSRLFIDTFPQNLWQIGKPQKLLFDSAASPPNAIITDTINSYPINNYSVFMIRNSASMGDVYGFKNFHAEYNVQTDSLNDYGMIEFSPDLGTTWIDIVNDTTYAASFVWFSQKPILTGNSLGWKSFDVLLADLGSVFNIQLDDTLLFRFTFTSDSIPDSLGGLMYDNLCFISFVEGVFEPQFMPIKSKIYPNPSANIFTIEFKNPSSGQFELCVYDIHSKLILKKDNITENKIAVDANLFQPGTYIYKITNWKTKQRCWGKFVTLK